MELPLRRPQLSTLTGARLRLVLAQTCTLSSLQHPRLFDQEPQEGKDRPHYPVRRRATMTSFGQAQSQHQLLPPALDVKPSLSTTLDVRVSLVPLLRHSHSTSRKQLTWRKKKRQSRRDDRQRDLRGTSPLLTSGPQLWITLSHFPRRQQCSRMEVPTRLLILRPPAPFLREERRQGRGA